MSLCRRMFSFSTNGEGHQGAGHRTRPIHVRRLVQTSLYGVAVLGPNGPITNQSFDDSVSGSLLTADSDRGSFAAGPDHQLLSQNPQKVLSVNCIYDLRNGGSEK